MRKLIDRYVTYGISITHDASAYYIEDDNGNIIGQPFPKRLPETLHGVQYFFTNEEVWIEAGVIMRDMDKALELIN